MLRIIVLHPPQFFFVLHHELLIEVVFEKLLMSLKYVQLQLQLCSIQLQQAFMKHHKLHRTKRLSRFDNIVNIEKRLTRILWREKSSLIVGDVALVPNNLELLSQSGNHDTCILQLQDLAPIDFLLQLMTKQSPIIRITSAIFDRRRDVRQGWSFV